MVALLESESCRANADDAGGTPSMLRRNSGRIINVASGSGASATPHMSAYVTGKAALIRLTEIITIEVATSGVRAFEIDTGTVRTNMVEEAINSAQGNELLVERADNDP